jgi:hypothetical protein
LPKGDESGNQKVSGNHESCLQPGRFSRPKEFEMKNRNHAIATMLVVSVFLLVPFSCAFFKLAERLVNTTGVRTGKEAIPSPE